MVQLVLGIDHVTGSEHWEFWHGLWGPYDRAYLSAMDDREQRWRQWGWFNAFHADVFFTSYHSVLWHLSPYGNPWSSYIDDFLTQKTDIYQALLRFLQDKSPSRICCIQRLIHCWHTSVNNFAYPLVFPRNLVTAVTRC